MTVSVQSLPDKRLSAERDLLAVPQPQNERLIALLEANGTDRRLAQEPPKSSSKSDRRGFRRTRKWCSFAGCFAVLWMDF
mgnify:CR=1 FL=1